MRVGRNGASGSRADGFPVRGTREKIVARPSRDIYRIYVVYRERLFVTMLCDGLSIDGNVADGALQDRPFTTHTSAPDMDMQHPDPAQQPDSRPPSPDVTPV